ncbi:MAG: TRAP transporter small permease [Spirochaetaceae bacterium]|nr:TRAP transporter small permease [Spirochaetaceae bacterium]
MKNFMAAIRKTDVVLYVLAGSVLVFMVLLTLADVILRNFGHPITGSMEIIQFGGSLVFGFSVPYATFLKAQVQVDIIIEKLKPETQKAVTVITRIVGVLLFLFVSYNFFLYALDVKRTGELSASFRIPYYPLVFALSFSFLLQGLTVFYDLIETLRGESAEKEEVKA